MLGALMVLTNEWKKPGVFNVEELNPDPFMEKIGSYGLPWQIEENIDLELPY
jgi:saccharopine dehydrogenase (NAD+, L-lysine-forming)